MDIDTIIATLIQLKKENEAYKATIERLRTQNRDNHKKRYHTDPEYRQKILDRANQYYREKKKGAVQAA